MTTGNKPTPALNYPSLGSLTTRLLKAERGVPPYVSFGEIRGEGPYPFGEPASGSDPLRQNPLCETLLGAKSPCEDFCIPGEASNV